MSNIKTVNGAQIVDYSDEISILQKFLDEMVNSHNDLFNKQDDACSCLDRPIESIMESIKDYKLRQEEEKNIESFANENTF